MILLVDADSLIFASCLKNKETIIDQKFYTYIEECKNKFDQQFMKIVNDLEELYDIKKVLLFNGSKGNFRKIITPKYKANRKKIQIPPLLNDMHEYVFNNYNGIQAFGIETDDLVAKYWYEISKEVGRNNVMIVSIDKDYKQFPALIYNYHYNHRQVLDITEEQAMYNFYEQMIVGDVADNVQYMKGKGVAFAKKYYKGCKTKYQYTRKLYELFQKEYKGKARQKYEECYYLLKLRTQ
jgi:5'-3' exonuclease